MAPEVMLCETFPEKRYNKLADIWSFGITLIEMAEERPPYSEMNPAKVVFKIIKAEPPSLERPSQWSSSFRDVVSHCLVKDPQNRPTAADLIAHPFFTREGDFACVRRLICEVNAEQVTTEVMPSDVDDDDDTSSSTDVRGPFDVHSVDILENEMESDTLASELDATPRPSPAETRTAMPPSPTKNAMLPPRTPTKVEIPPVELEFTPQVGPVAHAPWKVTPQDEQEQEEDHFGAEEDHVGDSAVISALTDLDYALKFEDSAQIELPEEPPTMAPSPVPTPPLHSLVIGDEESSTEEEESKQMAQAAPLRSPGSAPSHRIKDIVADAKQQSMSVRISPEPEFERNEGKTVDVVACPVSPPLRPPPPSSEIREVLREAHFSKPATSAHVTRTFNDAQAHLPGKITLTVGVGFLVFFLLNVGDSILIRPTA
ncbi:unnamed protein product [Toxocara canis]|uniref:Protein kinase domain-containing protein n=1 Tax=Toxocara canis TaxID=6265 RepID=A0A183U087_TOXCA|nr:unnamed protein product [Toxocara canis]